MKKPRGYFEKIIAIDCETSGMNFTDPDLSKNYQSVSWGIISSSVEHFKPIEKLYVEIKWNKECRWEWKAEKIHALSREYLEENGMDEADAAATIGEFLYNFYDGIDCGIVCLGHNVAAFDVIFLKKLLYKYGLNFKFAHRALDSFSLSMPTVKTYNSDDLFEAMGMNIENAHNSLADAEMALETFRRVQMVWKRCTGF